MKLDREFIKLPLLFDQEQLTKEVLQFPESVWRSHPQGFPGNSAIILISKDGEQNDDNAGQMEQTPLLDKCPYIKQVLSSFESVFGRSRLMRLAPGASVGEHSDINYHWYNRVRIHVPIITFPEVQFYCGEKNIHMASGEAWIFDSWKLHRVENPTNKHRVHLVVDTTGSAAFWNMAKRALLNDSDEAKFIPFDPKRITQVRTEKRNSSIVMHPGELDALLIDLLKDIDHSKAQNSTDIPFFTQLINDFRWEWRSIWSEFGTDKASWPKYAFILEDITNKVKLITSPLVLSSNETSAIQVLHARVLIHALNTQLSRDQALIKTSRESGKKQSRNGPCYCGSGKKYKRCHGA